MISEKENTRISKFLSLVLRHKPDAIGIDLDDNGWADVETLIVKSNENGIPLDKALLRHIVESNAKKRFTCNDSFDKIRASQGHSIEIEMGYESRVPPETLYHGTADRFVSSILETGLRKMERQHVHLSVDRETAVSVGQRHGRPYIFEVRASEMYGDGLSFYLSENNVWLTDHVPTKYLRES